MTRLTRLSLFDAIVSIDEAEEITRETHEIHERTEFQAEIAKKAIERELRLILDSAGKAAGVNPLLNAVGLVAHYPKISFDSISCRIRKEQNAKQTKGCLTGKSQFVAIYLLDSLTRFVERRLAYFSMTPITKLLIAVSPF